ncbi:MAG: alanine racemase [Chloroherpetonaceae bacterium]|nr:alanine racemase [Chthonomonadaceae bacterium]MDW8208265.1 alanine racemase [Chloroherpetonaceae bacterium]
MRTIDQIETPALLVDLPRLQANILRVQRLAQQSGKYLRPHAKTHKSPALARLQVSCGASGLTVAKVGEAEIFVSEGFTDVFVANEIVSKEKLERLVRLQDRAHISIGVDSIPTAEALVACAGARGARFRVLLECDTGLGRAGVRSVAEALQVGQLIAECPGLRFAGIFTHEGHLYRFSDPEERRQRARQAVEQLQAVREALERIGLECHTVSVGSTPGVDAMASEPSVTEMRPGNYVFFDRMQVRLGARVEDCALSVLATVTGVYRDGRVVIDAGAKALAGDCPFDDRTWGEVVGHPDWTFVAASEEHGMIQLCPGSAAPRVGDKVQILPNHACTCVNMHDELFVCQEGVLVDIWRIAARGKSR